MITLTKEQLSEVMCKHAEKENGVNDFLEIMLESLMVAERGEFLQEHADRNKGNGYRLGHTYGHGRKLEFRIPRDRFGNFHPKILAILKDQEEECERLAGSLYTKGLTQSQVGQVFDEIYGEHYSKTSISRMIEYVRRDVAEWLERGFQAPAAESDPREVFHQLPDWLEKCKFVRSLNCRVRSGHTNWNTTGSPKRRIASSSRGTV